MKQNKRKCHFSDIIVFLSIFAIIIYTIGAFIMQFMGLMEISSTLTTCWYAFWTAEVISLASIKNSKTKHNAEIKSENTNESEG